jgi:hypothetical protein
MFIAYYNGEELELIPLYQPKKPIIFNQLLTDPFISGWDDTGT